MERAKLFQRMVVNESYVRVVALGQDGAAALSAMTEAVLQLVATIEASCDDESREMLEVACQEVRIVTRCLRMLLGLEPAETAVLDDVYSSKQGCKQGVKNAVLRQSFYRAGETKAREVCVANLTLLPELQRVQKELTTEFVGLDRCVAISKRLAVWKEGLLEGDPAEVRASLQE